MFILVCISFPIGCSSCRYYISPISKVGSPWMALQLTCTVSYQVSCIPRVAALPSGTKKSIELVLIGMLERGERTVMVAAADATKLPNNGSRAISTGNQITNCVIINIARIIYFQLDEHFHEYTKSVWTEHGPENT